MDSVTITMPPFFFYRDKQMDTQFGSSGLGSGGPGRTVLSPSFRDWKRLHLRVCGYWSGADLASIFRGGRELTSLGSKGKAWASSSVQGQECLYEARLALGLRAEVATHQELEDVIGNIEHTVAHGPGG